MKPSDRHCWIDFVTPLYTGYVSSGFRLASLGGLPPTAAAAAPMFQSYRTYLAVKQCMLNKWSQTDRQWQHRDGILIPFTTDRSVVPTNDLRIVSCGCIILKTRGCRKAWLYRSPMSSHCNGQTCNNTPSLPASNLYKMIRSDVNTTTLAM